MEIFTRPIAAIFIGFIKLYQLIISPMFVSSCRHQPTCSEYCVEAIKAHGLIYGCYIGLKESYGVGQVDHLGMIRCLRKMSNEQAFLYSGFLFILILIFDAYDRDYNQPKVNTLSQENNIAQGEPKGPPTAGVDDNISLKSAKNVRDIQTLENNKLFVEYDAKSGSFFLRNLKIIRLALGQMIK